MSIGNVNFLVNQLFEVKERLFLKTLDSGLVLQNKTESFEQSLTFADSEEHAT